MSDWNEEDPQPSDRNEEDGPLHEDPHPSEWNWRNGYPIQGPIQDFIYGDGSSAMSANEKNKKLLEGADCETKAEYNQLWYKGLGVQFAAWLESNDDAKEFILWQSKQMSNAAEQFEAGMAEHSEEWGSLPTGWLLGMLRDSHELSEVQNDWIRHEFGFDEEEEEDDD